MYPHILIITFSIITKPYTTCLFFFPPLVVLLSLPPFFFFFFFFKLFEEIPGILLLYNPLENMDISLCEHISFSYLAKRTVIP